MKIKLASSLLLILFSSNIAGEMSEQYATADGGGEGKKCSENPDQSILKACESKIQKTEKESTSKPNTADAQALEELDIQQVFSIRVPAVLPENI